METVEWLSSYATEAQQGLIKPLATERGGKGIYKAIKQAVVFTLIPNIFEFLSAAMGQPDGDNVNSLDYYRWNKHCRGLFELPVAA